MLINPRKRWPRTRTTFAVIDAKRMQLRRHIRLGGDFSFDAISPTAGWSTASRQGRRRLSTTA